MKLFVLLLYFFVVEKFGSALARPVRPISCCLGSHGDVLRPNFSTLRRANSFTDSHWDIQGPLHDVAFSRL